MKHRYLFIIAFVCVISAAQLLLAQPEGVTWQRNFALVGKVALNGATAVKEYQVNGKTYLLANGGTYNAYNDYYNQQYLANNNPPPVPLSTIVGNLNVIDVTDPTNPKIVVTIHGWNKNLENIFTPNIPKGAFDLGGEIELYTSGSNTYVYFVGGSYPGDNGGTYSGFVFNLQDIISNYLGDDIGIDPDVVKGGVYVNPSATNNSLNSDASFFTGTFPNVGGAIPPDRCNTITAQSPGVEMMAVDIPAAKLFLTGDALDVYDLAAPGAAANPGAAGNHIGVYQICTATFPTKSGNTAWLNKKVVIGGPTIHNISVANVSSNETKIYMACPGLGIAIATFQWTKNGGTWNAPQPEATGSGALVIQAYDDDRYTPQSVISTTADGGDDRYDHRICHTVVPFDNGNYVISNDELAFGSPGGTGDFATIAALQPQTFTAPNNSHYTITVNDFNPDLNRDITGPPNNYTDNIYTYPSQGGAYKGQQVKILGNWYYYHSQSPGPTIDTAYYFDDDGGDNNLLGDDYGSFSAPVPIDQNSFPANNPPWSAPTWTQPNSWLLNNARVGAFARIWNTANGIFGAVTTSTDPKVTPLIGCYDAPESYTEQQGITSLSQITIPQIQSPYVGCNSMHRMRVKNVQGDDIAFFAGYATGVRALALPIVNNVPQPKEVGYLDNFPTLTDDPSNQKYTASYNQYNHYRDNLKFEEHWGHWEGIYDVYPDDASNSRLVFATSPQGETDPSHIGLLETSTSEGGLYIYNFYYKTIDGTLSAIPTWQNSPDDITPEIKFAGVFTVGAAAAATIASGVTVTLLPGTTSNPSQFLNPSNGAQTIEVKNGATLIVALANGDKDPVTQGGDVVACNILVDAGGTLIVPTGANARFAGNVTINPSANGVPAGQWIVQAGAQIHLGYENLYACGGTFNAQGTSQSGIRLYNYDYNPTIQQQNAYPFIICSGAIANASFCQFSNVAIRGVHCGAAGVTNTIANCTFSAPPLDHFRCVSWVAPQSSFDATSNTLTGTPDPITGQSLGYGIEIDDDPNGYTTVENNNVQTFDVGIGFYNAGGTAKNNNPITNCHVGIFGEGPVAPPTIYKIFSNTITGQAPNPITGIQNGYGVYNWVSDPYIYQNDISTTYNGVWMFQSSPKLACNKIYNNWEGLFVGITSLPEMTFAYGENLIHENDNSQIDCAGGDPLLDLGSNEIKDDRVANMTKKNLLTGAPAAGVMVLARSSYWGDAGTGATPPASPLPRSTFNFTWIPDDPGAPIPCAIPGSISCSEFPSPSDSELMTDPCSYWIDKYNHDQACGVCDDQINDLKQAIGICQSGNKQGNDPDGTLIKLLQQVLAANIACHQRDLPSLSAMCAYFDSVSHTLPTQKQQRAAKFMQAEATGVAQYFDNATTLFDSLAATATDTNDLSSDTIFANMMQYFKSLEGENTGSFGKVLHYAGRAGYVPVTENPLFLETYPNPFNPIAQISFTIPDEDASDVTEVKVFDMMARDVTTLVKDIEPAGRHTITFNASALPSGQYVVAVHTLNHMESKMIVLQK